MQTLLPPPPPPLGAGAAQAKLALPHEDPWLAPDKFQHFAFCFAVTAVGYWAARRHERARRLRLALGCATGVAAGVLKEIGDVLQVRRSVCAALHSIQHMPYSLYSLQMLGGREPALWPAAGSGWLPPACSVMHCLHVSFPSTLNCAVVAWRLVHSRLGGRRSWRGGSTSRAGGGRSAPPAGAGSHQATPGAAAAGAAAAAEGCGMRCRMLFP